MNRFQFLLIFLILASVVHAQDFEQDNGNNTFTASNYQQNKNFGRSDSIQGQHKEIPRGLKMWTIDNKFGDRTYVTPDTMSYLFMNTGLTSGLHGEYNTLGNLGSPRINRIFIQRKASSMFPFLDVYDFFNTPISDFRFTSTLSPITNITYNTAGDRTNGEDRFTALFAVNAGRNGGLALNSITFTGEDIIQIKTQATSTIRCGVLTLVTNIKRIYSLPSTTKRLPKMEVSSMMPTLPIRKSLTSRLAKTKYQLFFLPIGTETTINTSFSTTNIASDSIAKCL